MTNNGTLAAERIQEIAQVLRHRRIVRVKELCDAVGASPATIRRDLVEMERRGLLRRVHGGAVWAESLLEEPQFDDKATIAADQKQRIAELALQYVQPNDSVFLDGGSTVLALAHLLVPLPGLTVVTNSLRVAAVFATGGPRLILVGGEFRRRSQTFVGPLTQPLVERLHVDTAFIGTIGLDNGAGMTTTDPREAQTKNLVMTHANRVILLADGSKLGKVSFVEFGALERVDILVTDRGGSRRALAPLRKKGIKIIT